MVNESLGLREPAEAKAPSCIVIHVASVNGYARDTMNIMIPGVHCDTEKEDTKGPTHIDPIMDR